MVRENSASNYGPCRIDILSVTLLISSSTSVCSVKVPHTTDSGDPALDSQLSFGTRLCEVVPKAARSLGVVRWVEKLFCCSRVLKSYSNAYVLSSLEYF